MRGTRAVAVAAIMAGLTAVGSGQTSTTSIALELPVSGGGPIKLSIEAPAGVSPQALTGARVLLSKPPDFSVEVAETLGIGLASWKKLAKESEPNIVIHVSNADSVVWEADGKKAKRRFRFFTQLTLHGKEIGCMSELGELEFTRPQVDAMLAACRTLK